MSYTCKLCKSKKVIRVVDFEDSVPVDNFRDRKHQKITLEKFKMNLYFCKSCGHVQLRDVVDPNILFGEYIYESSSSPGLKKHFNNLYNQIDKKNLISKDDLIIDIGCNDGLLLENFINRGLKSVGVDPDKNSLVYAKKRGVITYNNYLNPIITKKIIKKFGKFNLVTATNVFSHSDNLNEFTKCISKLLKNKATFIFEVSYLKALMFDGVWDYVYHEHIAYHSIKPLNDFLKKYNIYIYDVDFLNVKGGSIRCYAKKSSTLLKENAKIKNIINKEKKFGFYKVSNFKKITEVKLNLKKNLNKKLIIKKNEIIASYGASATTTVISQELGYAQKISFIIDDNKSRQNKLSPGYLIPVLNFNSLRRYKPKYLIISAWRFKKQILKKCKSYIENGGIIIIPNPKIKIITKKNYEKEI
jgi:SAM-dependent methyltransferase